jgi:hypothetical protein
VSADPCQRPATTARRWGRWVRPPGPAWPRRSCGPDRPRTRRSDLR